VTFCTLGLGHAAPVSIRGRQILVRGKPVFLKGVNWNPVPKGSRQGNGLHFRGFVESDSELMAAAGINAVRTYEPITDTNVLDILWSKGIYVLNTVYITGGSEPESVVKPVGSLKDHPAILMWVIGNEWNYNMLYSNLTFAQALGRVRTVARLIKSLDDTHPVASVYGMVPGHEQLRALDDVDVWGLTAYTGLSFGSLFTTWAAHSQKPMFVAEYGADSYNAKTGSVDETDQATATVALTREVIKNSAANGGICTGGLIFELADEWWKDGTGSPSRHNKGGVAPGGGPFPDNTFNEEYWGLVSIDGTPRKAYRAYADLRAPGAPHHAGHSPGNISERYRMKACGANPGCVGNLGDCCPGKDGAFHGCCSAASKSLHRQQAWHRAAPEVTPNAHSHQTVWTAGAPPAHCELDQVVPCCPDGKCGSCAGNQCCPSEKGPVTCPSASKALAPGCDRPKTYDCTGRTGTRPPKNASGTTATGEPSSAPAERHRTTTTAASGVREKRFRKVSTTSPHPASHARTAPHSRKDDYPTHPPATTSRHPDQFVQHEATLSIPHNYGLDVSLHTTMPVPLEGIEVNVHTTMEAPSSVTMASTPTPKLVPVPREVGSWILGPERANCVEVCKNAGGCVEGNWPSSQREFMRIANTLGYACFDLQEGGGKYDPSTQQGNCGWQWNGGRELLSTMDFAAASRCATPAPAFTRRFCPCRSKLDSGHEGTPSKKPEVVMEKFPRGGWMFEETNFHRASSERSIFA